MVSTLAAVQSAKVSRMAKVAFGALTLAASASVGYYNPVRGIALLASAFIAWNVCSRILACFSKVQPEATKPEQSQSPLAPVAPATVVSNPEPIILKMPDLERMVQALRGETLTGVEDCTTYAFPTKEEGICYKGVDGQNRAFYAFQLFYKEKGSQEITTGMEVIYIVNPNPESPKGKGYLKAHSNPPGYFNTTEYIKRKPYEAFLGLKSGSFCAHSKTGLQCSLVRNSLAQA